MTDQIRDPLKSSSGSLSDLSRAYREKHAEWLAAATEVARLRNEVLGAANLDATTLVRTARAEIGRIVSSTREALGQLLEQTRKMVENDPKRLPDFSSTSSLIAQEGGARLADASDEIRRFAKEVASDLEALARDAVALHLPSLSHPMAEGAHADELLAYVDPADERPPAASASEPRYRSAGPGHTDVVVSDSPEATATSNVRTGGEEPGWDL